MTCANLKGSNESACTVNLSMTNISVLSTVLVVEIQERGFREVQ